MAPTEDEVNGVKLLDTRQFGRILIQVSPQLLESGDDGNGQSYASVCFNHKPNQFANSERSTTFSVDSKGKGYLKMQDTLEGTGEGEDDSGGTVNLYEYEGVGKACKDSYALIYDHSSQSYNLERLYASVAFNMVRETDSTGTVKSVTEVYPQLQISKVLPGESEDEDESVYEDIDMEPDPSNPYDFRHFLKHCSTPSPPAGLQGGNGNGSGNSTTGNAQASERSTIDGVNSNKERDAGSRDRATNKTKLSAMAVATSGLVEKGSGNKSTIVGELVNGKGERTISAKKADGANNSRKKLTGGKSKFKSDEFVIESESTTRTSATVNTTLTRVAKPTEEDNDNGLNVDGEATRKVEEEEGLEIDFGDEPAEEVTKKKRRMQLMNGITSNCGGPISLHSAVDSTHTSENEWKGKPGREVNVNSREEMVRMGGEEKEVNDSMPDARRDSISSRESWVEGASIGGGIGAEKVSDFDDADLEAKLMEGLTNEDEDPVVGTTVGAAGIVESDESEEE